MDIGTVISVDIENEERTCVILSKKYYSDFLLKDQKVLFLTRYHDNDINETVTVPFFVYKREGLPGDEIMCYELMYGDKRVWVIGETKLASMVKVPVAL